jgi:replicative DNA helicase
MARQNQKPAQQVDPQYVAETPRSPVTPEALSRAVPCSIEAEVCVLGSMILDSPCIDIVVQILREEYFHRPAHTTIFRTLIQMREQGKPIDLVMLREELQHAKFLDSVGGVEYLVALAEGVPGVSNIEHYANLVRDKALLRELIRAGRDICEEAHDSSDEPQVVIDRAEQRIFEIAQQQIVGQTSSIKDLLHATFELLQEHEGKAITGLSTGFPQLDELTAGLQNGEMIILAARPSMGKTALLLNIAEYMAAVDRRPVVFFSLEMSKMQITQRLLASHARFNLRNLRRTMISPEAWTELQAAAGDLEQAPLLIDDASTLTALQLRAKARRLKARFDIQAVFIDYLQLMTYYGRAENRQEQIAEMSRSLKALARELNLPVVCAAQLNRGPADRPTHVPRMSDLRESGSIEQDADVVALLHNEDYYHTGEDGYEPTRITKLIIEKQRNGPTGILDLVFRTDCTRFEQAAAGYVMASADDDRAAAPF